MQSKKINFDKILGSKLDGRGGQLFYLGRQSRRIIPRFDFYVFYVRADDGLRDAWVELDLNAEDYDGFVSETRLSSLPLSTVSFEYLKKRVRDGIAYKNLQKKFLPAEFENCAPILEYEAKDDLIWETPAFFSKTLKAYNLELPKKKLLSVIQNLVNELSSEMLLLGWGFNDEEMDLEYPTFSKLKFNPMDIWFRRKFLDIFHESKLETQSRSLDRLMHDLMDKIISKDKIEEWRVRTQEEAYFCYNIGEKEIAEKLHKISLTLGAIGEKVDMKDHPFLQMLMLISITATLKRHEMK